MIAEFLARLTALGDQYPWLGPVSAILTIATTVFAAIVWELRKATSNANSKRREAEERCERLEDDIVAFKSEIKLLKQRLPEAAWEAVDRERRDGNEENAIGALRHHMETEGAKLGEMARQIARFHFGLVTERSGDLHLSSSPIRFAQLAFHLDPRQGEAGELLKEVQQLRGDVSFEHVMFTDDVFTAEHDPVSYHGLPQTPAAVASLIGRRLEGDPTAAIIGMRTPWQTPRSSPHAGRTLGEREPMALGARYWRAVALDRLGRYELALAEIDGTDAKKGILALQEQSPDAGPEHPSTLTTRSLRARILQDLGRYGLALAEIDGTDAKKGILAPQEQNPDAGPEHPSTLTTRYLRTRQCWTISGATAGPGRDRRHRREEGDPRPARAEHRCRP